jgi:mRNA-degrading endonuclease toxin of MazEF toxin-antitoxin module
MSLLIIISQPTDHRPVLIVMPELLQENIIMMYICMLGELHEKLFVY